MSNEKDVMVSRDGKVRCDSLRSVRTTGCVALSCSIDITKDSTELELALRKTANKFFGSSEAYYVNKVQHDIYTATA